MKPLVLDPDQSFPFRPETMGKEGPTFYLLTLTKKQRDSIFLGPMLEGLMKAGGELEDEVAGNMSVQLFRELSAAVPEMSQKIARIENVTVIENGEEKTYSNMVEKDKIEQVYNVLPMMADIEMRLAIITHSFISDEEAAILGSPPSSL